MRLKNVADWIEETADETLTYHRLPDKHLRRIRTNNPLERIMREIRRRTRVVWGRSQTTNPPSSWLRPG